MRRPCVNHPEENAVAKCLICGKDICADCRATLGYFCSEKCRDLSREHVNVFEKENKEKSYQTNEKIVAVAKIAFAIIAVLLVSAASFYAYKFFLSPVGKLSWKISFDQPRANAKILSASDTNAVIKSGDEIFEITPETGKIVRRISLKDYPSGYGVEEIVSGDKLIAALNKKLKAYSFAGEILWENSFFKNISSISSPGKILFITLTPDFSGEAENENPSAGKKIDIDNELRALDISTGKELWAQKLKGTSLFKSSSSNEIFVMSSLSMENQSSVKYVIKAFDPNDGKEKWQIKIDFHIDSLSVIGNKVIFQSDQKINAVSADGKKKLWTIPFFGFFDEKYLIPADGGIIVFDGQKLLRINDVDGKISWEKTCVMPSPDSIASTEKHLFVISNEKQDAKVQTGEEKALPETFDKLGNKDLLREAITNAKKCGKYTSVLNCFDTGNGNLVWKKEKIYGSIIAAKNILINIHDTADAQIMILSPGAGETIISGISPDSGKILFQKRDKTGICPPLQIVGNHLLGFEFIREKGAFHVYQTGKDEDFYIAGIAAFRIK